MGSLRAFAACAFCALALALCSTASAQTAPRPAGAADAWRVEADLDGWRPSLDASLSSDTPGTAGTLIDFTRELGAADRWLVPAHLVWRPARHHAIRFAFMSASYASTATAPRAMVFSGVRFTAGDRVAQTLSWTTYRVGYAYDVLRRPAGSIGVIIDLMQNQLEASLAAPGTAASRRTRIPLPMIGAAGRLAFGPRVTVAAEFTGFAVPDNAARTYGGHLFDFDARMAVRLARHLFAIAGYRTIDIYHLGDTDSGFLSFTGVHIGTSVRF